MKSILCTISRFCNIHNWRCHYYTSYSLGQILTRNSYKNKTDCYAIAICGRSFPNKADTTWIYPRFLNKEQPSAKFMFTSTKFKKLWLICVGITFCPPHTWMTSMCGGKTWKCPILLNIGPNHLIFSLKDRLYIFQEELNRFSFVYDQPFLQYLQLKKPLLHIILSWTNFDKKSFQK